MIHILYNGQTLCGEFWPVLSQKYPGDQWVRVEDKKEATCPQCILYVTLLPSNFKSTP